VLTIQEVKEALSYGVSEANAQYIKWSGGLSVQDHGVENLMSSWMAKSLFDLGSKKDSQCYVTLETSFREIAEGAGQKGPGRWPSRLNGRCDVVYYDRNGNATGLIEIKRWFGYSRQKNDIDRLTTMMEKCSSIKWSAVAAIRQRWQTTRDEASATLDKFIESAESDFGNFRFLSFHKFSENDSSTYDDPAFLGYDALGAVIHRRKAE